METEAERYLLIQEKSGLSKKDFAVSLGIGKEQGSQIGRGRYRPSRQVLENLVSIYNVNLTWFITGRGEPEGEPGGTAIELLELEAATGRGIEDEDYPDRRMIQVPYETIKPHRSQNLKAVYVSGDSMIDEKINDGDIVIFNSQQTEGNGIYVVSIGSTRLVKRVQFDEFENTIILISANTAYAPRIIKDDELEMFRIQGRVVSCLHRF